MTTIRLRPCPTHESLEQFRRGQLPEAGQQGAGAAPLLLVAEGQRITGPQFSLLHSQRGEPGPQLLEQGADLGKVRKTRTDDTKNAIAQGK